MENTNLAVGEKYHLDNSGVKKWLVLPFRRHKLRKYIGELYQQLPMGINDTIFGVKIKYLLGIRHGINHT